jgi:oligo-1,6-glucosidase/alpha-glucosidase
LISRLGGSIEKAKLLALFQFTCRGIPFTYFGDEIGIPRVRIPLKQGKDAIARQHDWIPQPLVDRSVEILNRDECRTPMLWNSKPNAGFCHHATEPWLPVAENFTEINVEKQMADPHSLLSFYKKVIRLRKETPALHEGSLEIAHDQCSKKILAYYRTSNGSKYLIMLNMSGSRVRNPASNVNVLLSTHPQGETHHLQPFEGRAIRLA